ncbi:MAG: 3-dehydroquinate synthase [Phycisphaerales bacterium]
MIVSVTGPFAHDVVIERDLLDRAGAHLLRTGIRRGAKVVVAMDANVVAPHGERLERALASSGFEVTRTSLVADESRKTMPAVEALWSVALAARLGRDDAFVALGGGLVGDVVGFAAATYLRGVAVVQVPTTLLAMVDASTGGKTGVNVPLPAAPGGGAKSLGKNLAGAFWPPKVVLADPTTLATLPPRELRSGLAECVKHAMIDGVDHLDFLDRSLDRILALEPDAIAELVARSVTVKAGVVSRDPREAGERATLNLGHTFAHALETHPALELTHGEAVAIGLVAACALAEATGEGTPTWRGRVESLVGRCGLPTRVAPEPESAIGVADVLGRMGFDKKAHGGTIRFVVPASPGAVRWGAVVPDAAVRAALAAVGVA